MPEFLRDLQLEFTTLTFICLTNFASSTIGLTVGGHLKIVGAGGFLSHFPLADFTFLSSEKIARKGKTFRTGPQIDWMIEYFFMGCNAKCFLTEVDDKLGGIGAQQQQSI